ncbi:hypothetical protein [Pleomorphomonas sp. NRK KF1]|uniref:hypothetical protein n=1 Tax=Pleomorphomonas sp. NRK KF1 TaxID=2943000 RepID=UPI0020439873|nr:hypothetical protein [Pleomorphomonas sp. NRK KF1]MCM5555142.1 hypothetical protein [Pleomorphomonas sp. NRK KF1]
MPNIHYLTFGGGRPSFRKALKSRSRQAERSQFFSSVTTVSDIDIRREESFWQSHGDFIEKNPKGYGYWLWKPYILIQQMKKIPDGDILYYIDVGCEVNKFGKRRLDYYNSMIEDRDILIFELGLPAESWTKGDLLHLFPGVRGHNQFMGGVIGIKIGPRSREFVSRWFNLCCQNEYRYLDDSPSTMPNDSTFQEHRHDQACLTAIARDWKNVAVLNASEFDLDTIMDKPFLVLRNRSKRVKTIQFSLFNTNYLILRRKHKRWKIFKSEIE